jgi:hypothetical protein
VDWTGFDVVGVDLYRDEFSRPRFGRAVQVFMKKAKRTAADHRGVRLLHLPVAADRGGSGFGIIDRGGDQSHVNGDYVRDEAEQAGRSTGCLDIFEAGGANIAFVQTFVQPLNLWNPDPDSTSP